MIVGLIILLLVQIVSIGGSFYFYLEGKISGVSCFFMALSSLCALGCTMMILFNFTEPSHLTVPYVQLSLIQE